MGQAIKTVGNIAQKIAPMASFIPGVGTMAGAALGGLGGLMSGGGFSGAAQGALGGFMGGQAHAQGGGFMSGLAGMLGNGQGGLSGMGMLGAGAGLAGLGAIASNNGAFNPHITSVGGGGATQTADQYSSFLGNALNQTGGMKDALSSMMQGRVGDPSSLKGYFDAGMGGNGGAQFGQSDAGFNPNQINNSFTPEHASSNFQGGQYGGGYYPSQVQGSYNGQDAQFSNVGSAFNPQDIQAGQIQSSFASPAFQMAQLQGMQTGNPTSSISAAPVNTNFNFGGVGVNYNPSTLSSNYNPQQIQTQYNAPQFQSHLDSIINPQANRDAMSALMDRQQNLDVANLRARFGNQAMGTSAQYGESQYLAEALPRKALALDEITRQNQAQQLTQRSQDLQQQLAGNQFNQGNAQFGADYALRGELANASNQQAANQMNLAAQQGNSSNAQFGASLGLDAGKTNLNAHLETQRMANQAQQFNANLALESQKATAANQLTAMGLSNDAIKNMNGEQLQQILALNAQNQQGGQFAAAQQMQAQMQNQQNAMQVAQINNQNNQFGYSQNMQGQLANQQAQLQASQINNQNQQFGAGQNFQAQQLNNQNQLAQASQMLQAQGMSQADAQFKAQQMLAATGMNNQYGLAGGQLNAQIGQMNNQFGFDAAKMNQGNQQFNANAALQNQQQMNQWNQGLHQTGLGMQSNQLAAQTNALNQLMAALGRTQGLGTAQAETAIGQSTASQMAALLGAGGSMYGAYNQARNAGPQQQMQMPLPGPVNFPGLSPQQMLPLPGPVNYPGLTPQQMRPPVMNPFSLPGMSYGY